MIKLTANAIAAMIVILAVAAVYIFRLNTAAGLMVDDGWYVMLARALAHGDGYRLILK